MGWRIAYSHDKNGNATGGDIDKLISAILHGSSVKIIPHITDSDATPHYTLSEYAIRVWVYKQQVFASTLQYHSNFNSNEISWVHRNQPFVSIWGTDGKERVEGTTRVYKWAMDWCVD